MTVALDKNVQYKLFFDMLRIRRIEEAIGESYSDQKMRCPVHLSSGQEAVAVGICSHLGRNDPLLSNHRSHAHYLAKGGSFHKMIAELHGKLTGCSAGRGGSMHLIDLNVSFQGASPIAAGSIPIAAGMAFASKLKDDSTISTVFFGEAATEEGLFAETLNFASLKELPLLLVCENNQYAVHSPTSERQSKSRSLLKLAEAHGIYNDSADGNQIESVYETAERAIEHIRAGKGPAFLEFATYRICEHTGPSRSNDLAYRSEAELTSWKERCPIKQYQEKLNLSPDDLNIMEAKISTEIKTGFTFAEESPFPLFDLDDEQEYAE